ncbi:hypothetical protein [Paenibacillus sinopodophylli]|uniref:hypothetical protein n=1 Tax=Paenibacillus sinopodophylli TaxID=1837342 RepID=UPI00110CB6C1|nr:hypothetical protein [Paenibacillus sinopodophylli]
MNKDVYEFGHISRKRIMNLLIIVPLLLAALFAYQAGNMFEQTAGASRIIAGARYAASVSVGKKNGTTKSFLPENQLLVSYLSALMRIFRHSVSRFELRTTIPQRLRDLLMNPIKFTSHFVG